jgi:hypothetical protein
MEFFKKVWDKSGVDLTAKVIVGLIVAVATLVAVSFSDVREFLVRSVTLRWWLILLALPFILFSLARLVAFFWRPVHEGLYRKDWIDGIEWRWSYKGGKVRDLTPHCIVDGCSVRLVLDLTKDTITGGPVTRIWCPSCNAGFAITGVSDLPDVEVRKIEQRIENRKWQEHASAGRPAGVNPYKPAPPPVIHSPANAAATTAAKLESPARKRFPLKPPSNPSGVAASTPLWRHKAQDSQASAAHQPSSEATQESKSNPAPSLSVEQAIETLRRAGPFHPTDAKHPWWD